MYSIVFVGSHSNHVSIFEKNRMTPVSYDVHLLFTYTFKPAYSELSQLMRLWYLSHRRPAKASHMKSGRRRRVRPKIRYLAPLDGCAYAFEE